MERIVNFYGNAEELIDSPGAPTEFIIDRILPTGLTVLGGSQKSGKSFMVMQIGSCVAQGKDIWGFKTQKCTVLYLCLEDTIKRLRNRLIAVSDEDPEDFIFKNYSSKLGEGFEAEIDLHMQRYPETKLVIIDVFQLVRPDAGNFGYSYSQDYLDMRALKSIADEYSIAVLVVHHMKKMREDDPMNNLTGTVGITGAADNTWVLSRKRGQKEATMDIEGRDVDATRIKLSFEDQRWIMEEVQTSEEVAKEKIPDIVNKVIAFMRNRPYWDGIAIELLEAMHDCTTRPNVLKRHLGTYEQVLFQNGISYHNYPRKSDRRAFTMFNLNYRESEQSADDANDANDAKIDSDAKHRYNALRPAI